MKPIGFPSVRANGNTKAASHVPEVLVPEGVAFGRVDLESPVTSDFHSFFKRNRSAWALFGADLAGIAETLNAKIDRLVRLKGNIRGDDGRPDVTSQLWGDH